MSFVIDGQRQPRPAPAPDIRLILRIPSEEVDVIESDSDSSWAAWDAAVARQDSIAGAHE